MNKKTIVAGLAMGAVGIILIAKAAGGHEPPPPPPPGLANLWGTVKDKSTGQALPGVDLTLDGLIYVTDDAGYFEFLEIAPGTYNISFTKDGYEPIP